MCNGFLHSGGGQSQRAPDGGGSIGCVEWQRTHPRWHLGRIDCHGLFAGSAAWQACEMATLGALRSISEGMGAKKLEAYAAEVLRVCAGWVLNSQPL